MKEFFKNKDDLVENNPPQLGKTLTNLKVKNKNVSNQDPYAA